MTSMKVDMSVPSLLARGATEHYQQRLVADWRTKFKCNHCQQIKNQLDNKYTLHKCKTIIS